MNAARRPTPSRRAVLVAGARTPFAKAFGELASLDTIALGLAAARGVLERVSLDPSLVQEVVWGGVILPSAAPNVGREIALDLGMAATATGVTVSRACASGLQAITHAAAAIERGDYDIALAGGSDSTSNAEVKLPPKLVQTLAPLALGKPSASAVVAALPQLLPLRDIVPRMPKIAERTTGELMGESAEDMARRNDISRREQDAFALRSHHRAAAAIAAGVIGDELVPVELPGRQLLAADTLVRADASMERLERLKPAFAKQGTLTAGNSTTLTDGAACVLVAEESRARTLGLPVLARVVDWTYVAVDPRDQLLLGPAVAIPRLLDRLGMELGEVDLVDLHEAFAAQVLSVLKLLGSDAFARHRLGRTKAVGTVDDDRLNVHGGSLAFGHPFGATGARMATTMAYELQRSGRRHALLGICAAGGLGAAALLERAD